MLLRPLCWMTGHDWKTIKIDNTILAREGRKNNFNIIT